MKSRFAVRAIRTLRVSYPLVKMSVNVQDSSANAAYDVDVWADITDEDVVIGATGLDVERDDQGAAFWAVMGDPELRAWALSAACAHALTNHGNVAPEGARCLA